MRHTRWILMATMFIVFISVGDSWCEKTASSSGLLVLQGNETYSTGGGLQPSELSDLQGIPRNNVSTLLAGLEEEGLISRELNGTDRRKFVIRLTPQGRKTLKSKLGTQFRQITRCFTTFSHKERATLLDLLTRLTQSLSEMNGRDEE